MLEMLLSSENYIFSSFIFFIVGFFILEIFLLIFGLDILQLDDGLFESTPLEQISSFITKSKIPIIVFIILFSFVFGFSGLIFQFITKNLNINQFVTCIIVFPFSLIAVRYLSIPFSKISIKDETTIVSKNSFIGEKGYIVLGIAKREFPAEAKFIDIYGREHYFLVEPLNVEQEFKEGEEVVIVEKKSDSIFYVIKKYI